MAHKIRTTHAGSLPRPDDLVEMTWARMDVAWLKLRSLAEGAAIASAEL